METPDFYQIATQFLSGMGMLEDPLLAGPIAEQLRLVWNARGAADLAAFRAGFQAGFAVSREGFNGECRYDHCAPGRFAGEDDALQAAEDAAVAIFVSLPDA
jgi:hypothetical protein